MTPGKEAEYANTPDAQWIKRQLEKRGWLKKDLAEALVAASGGRLKIGGADGFVNRVTFRGGKPQKENRELLATVFGEQPPSEGSQWEILHTRLEALAAEVETLQLAKQELATQNGELEQRIATLESQRPAAADAPKRPRKRASK